MYRARDSQVNINELVSVINMPLSSICHNLFVECQIGNIVKVQ